MTRWILTGLTASSLVAAAALTIGDAWFATIGPEAPAGGASIRYGRYLVQIGGCNDCHTPDYVQKEGNVPEDRWLIGDGVGFNGPWGTTYPTNLRRHMGGMTEDEWVEAARALKARPPMPWFNVRAMTQHDLRAIYRYVRSLPPDDNPVPDYVPPDGKPTTPYFVFVPRQPG